MCIHGIVSCTHGIPMGFIGPAVSNHIFRTPCDILHTFDCGIIKNVVLWVLGIVNGLPKVSNTHRFSEGRLDARITSMKDLCRLPNVTMTYFRIGLSNIMSNKIT